MTVYAVYRDGQLQGAPSRASTAAEVCQELTERYPGSIVFFLPVPDGSIPTELDSHLWNPLAAAEKISEYREDARQNRSRAAKRAAARAQPPDLFAPLEDA